MCTKCTPRNGVSGTKCTPGSGLIGLICMYLVTRNYCDYSFICLVFYLAWNFNIYIVWPALALEFLFFWPGTGVIIHIYILLTKNWSDYSYIYLVDRKLALLFIYLPGLIGNSHDYSYMNLVWPGTECLFLF